jgi:hypothetical protein
MCISNTLYTQFTYQRPTNTAISKTDVATLLNFMHQFDKVKLSFQLCQLQYLYVILGIFIV